MKSKEIAYCRLHHQSIATQIFERAEEVVTHLLAVQAQDYLGALWGIGLRTREAKEVDIERALADRSIVRTWPMRGTLHFVAATDVRWMLKLLAPKGIARSANLYKQSGLDNKVLTKCRKVVLQMLMKEKQLSRADIYIRLEKAKIHTADQRGLHILGHLAQEGVVCFGPRKAKQQTFALLDEWIPESRVLTRDESLAELATRYFKGHGPATLQDYYWWSGLTPAEARRSIEMSMSHLVPETINDKEYWMNRDFTAVKRQPAIYLLPAYDEYTVAYKDRSAILDSQYAEKARNGIFSAVVILDGKIAGTWSRSFKNERVSVEVKTFNKLKAAEVTQVNKQIELYSNFVGKNLNKIKISY